MCCGRSCSSGFPARQLHFAAVWRGRTASRTPRTRHDDGFRFMVRPHRPDLQPIHSSRLLLFDFVSGMNNLGTGIAGVRAIKRRTPERITRMGISISSFSRPVCRRIDRQLVRMKNGPITTRHFVEPAHGQSQQANGGQTQRPNPINPRSHSERGQQPPGPHGDQQNRQQQRFFVGFMKAPRSVVAG